LHNVNKLIDEINDEVDNIVNIKDDVVIIDNGTKLYITGNKQEMIIRDWQAYIMGYSER
jgi:frataxin-like iron-binding protein CyaY